METKVLRLVLDNSRIKPVFPLQISDKEEIICLLDSGAGLSIWCRDSETLKRCFTQIKKLDKQAHLSGFGGKGRKREEMRGRHDVYRIPLLSLSYGTDILRIHNLIPEPNILKKKYLKYSMNQFGNPIILRYNNS